MNTVIYFILNSEPISKSNLKIISSDDKAQTMNEKAILSVAGEDKAYNLSIDKELQHINAVYSSSYVRALETAKYIACENDTIINVDDRFDERKVGLMGDMTPKEFSRLQAKDFDFKLSGGESLNQTKRRMVEATKNVLMFEAGTRVAVITHAVALTCLLSSWCEIGKNYDDEIILSYEEASIVDGTFTTPMVFKVTFDGMNVKNVERLNI